MDNNLSRADTDAAIVGSSVPDAPSAKALPLTFRLSTNAALGCLLQGLGNNQHVEETRRRTASNIKRPIATDTAMLL